MKHYLAAMMMTNTSWVSIFDCSMPL